jgi:hypothetical protein
MKNKVRNFDPELARKSQEPYLKKVSIKFKKRQLMGLENPNKGK